MTPTETFDPRTAKQIAAKIVDDEACGHEEEDMTPLVELHTRCFTALGSTRLEIAAALARFGCLGRPANRVTDDGETYGDLVDRKDNPVAIYFRDVCGATYAEFGTDGGLIYWNGTLPGSEIGHEDVTLPPAVADFQRSYENFEYPHLHRPGAQPESPDQVIDRTPLTSEEMGELLDRVIAHHGPVIR